MTERLRVGMSEFRTACSPVILFTRGLGSCVGIALYDPGTKTGGLAHVLLPQPRGGAGERPARFVGAAVAAMLTELAGRGAARERMWAKIVGGAQMFPGHLPPAAGSIGERNVRAARSVLEALGIALAGAETGGVSGRALDFHLDTGQILVRFGRDRDKIVTL